MKPKNLGHVMLDLETLGNKSNSAILSIGAVEFNIETGETGFEFYERVDLQSCLNVGLIVNGSTFYWWLQQNEKARKEICKAADNLHNVLQKLNTYFAICGDFQLWGNGLTFDVSILENAYVKFGVQVMPWQFRNERDVRTLVAFAPEIKENYPFTGILHHPIADCKYQIGYCTAIWNKLNKQ